MPEENDDNIIPMVQCNVVEFDGEGEWGTHNFLYVPRKGEVIELWTNGLDLLARVEDIRHTELDDEGNGGDVTLFVKALD